MIDHMLGYKPPDDTDEAGFAGRFTPRSGPWTRRTVIKPVPGTSRYLIYGVITSVLSAERVEVLTARYRELAAGGPPRKAPQARGAATAPRRARMTEPGPEGGPSSWASSG